MALGTKYRCDFKNRNGITIRADILQEGYSGAVTEVKGGPEPLVTEWPGDRENLFNPVRGSVSTFTFYAETDGQFNEFFDGSNKEYQLRISYNSTEYWRGWLMLSDYYESLEPAPYLVTVKAYDLGMLQQVSWDKSEVANDSIIDVLIKILTETGLELVTTDHLNVYEDSINSTTGDSPIDQINIHQDVFMDDSWETITMYEALSRLLLPFNACIFQEWGRWRIVRIPDMAHSHYYRIWSTAGAKTGSSVFDPRKELSTFNQLAGTAVLMSCPIYKRLNFNFDYGRRNLIHNGLVGDISMVPTDYWTVTSGSGTLDFVTQTYYNEDGVVQVREQNWLEITGSSVRTEITHDKTYNTDSLSRIELNYGFEIDADAANTATTVSIVVKLVGSSTYYLDLSDGTWNASDSVGNITFSATARKYLTEGTVTSIGFPVAGVLSVIVKDANWGSGTGRTYLNLELKASPVPSDPPGSEKMLYNTNDFSVDINSENLEELSDVTFHFGDPESSMTRDLFAGSLTIASTGAATDQWTPANTGGATLPLLELARECYQAQYLSPARRIQASLIAPANEGALTVLQDSSDRCYMFATLSKYWRENLLDGEWIEIKQGTGAELVTSWSDEAVFDIFIDNGDTTFYVLAGETVSGTTESNSITVDSDYYYKVVVSISDDQDPGTWNLTWGTATENDIEDGDVFYLKPGSNTFIELELEEVTGGLEVESTVGISVKKYYGV
jgi:hypothetical protein